MIPSISPDADFRPLPARQPILLTAAVLVMLATGIGGIVIWRAQAGQTPETERAAAARQVQTRTAQVSEQLVEKTRGLELSQQQSIDQLQMVHDQLQTMRRLLAAQQSETQRLSTQVASLTDSIDGLRQSFASARAEPAVPVVRNRSVRTRAHAVSARRKATRTRS